MDIAALLKELDERRYAHAELAGTNTAVDNPRLVALFRKHRKIAQDLQHKWTEVSEEQAWFVAYQRKVHDAQNSPKATGNEIIIGEHPVEWLARKQKQHWSQKIYRITFYEKIPIDTAREYVNQIIGRI